jgi:hypothetical protein
MKIIITFLSTLLSLSTVLAGTIFCSPTIGTGDINFRTPGDAGIDRITEIEVKTGKPDVNGIGIVLTLKGTKGAFKEKAEDITIELPLWRTYGSTLFEYENFLTSQGHKPVIRFDMEKLKDNSNFLASLTYFSSINSNSSWLLTSRYNCKTTK